MHGTVVGQGRGRVGARDSPRTTEGSGWVCMAVEKRCLEDAVEAAAEAASTDEEREILGLTYVRACVRACVRVHGRMTPKNEKGRRTIILDSSSTKSPNCYQHLEHAAAAAAAEAAQLHLTFPPLSASTQIPQCLALLDAPTTHRIKSIDLSSHI